MGRDAHPLFLSSFLVNSIRVEVRFVDTPDEMTHSRLLSLEDEDEDEDEGEDACGGCSSSVV